MKLSPPIHRRLWLIVLAIVLIGVFFFVMTRAGPLAPTKVTVAHAKTGRLVPELFGIGTVEARRSWMVGPTVAGRVSKVHVDVGDGVKAGQVLAEMDPVDIDQRLASQDAAIERARSALSSATAQQTDAQARRELAASSLRRNQELADKTFISSGALESFVQARTSADAVLEAARANVAATAQDLVRIQADRSALTQQRAHVRLSAPSDGLVSARDAEPGSTVVAGQPVLRVVDPASLWVRLRVDQGRSAGLRQGLKARIVLRSQPQTSHSATVARVELLSDSVTEERIAQLAFDKAPVGLSPGEMVEATIELSSTADSLIVPAASIQRQGGFTGVWRLKSGQASFVRVKVGAASLDGRVQVLDGLQEDDELVVYSQKPLTSGSRLKVVDALVKSGDSSGVAP